MILIILHPILPHPRGTPGGKPLRLTARVKIARARPDRFWPAEPFFAVSVCLCVCPCIQSVVPNLGARWENRRRRFAPSNDGPQILHLPKRLRCDSDPAGAATPQIAPPTRAPAGRRLTDARHSRHARSRSHHGHRSATVTPESHHSRRLASCRAPRHCRLSTPPSSRDGGVERLLLRFLRGARQRARLYTSTDSLSNDGGPGRRVCRLRRLRPALPASSPMCAETCNWASDADCDDGGPGFRPALGRRHCGPDHRLMW